MTKEQFELDYCRNSEISIREYRNDFVTLTCDCDADNCRGFAAVSNNPLSIKSHIRLYAPRTGECN